jgi:hypothetical protein
MVDLEGKLRLHERFRSEVVRVGTEGTPVLVVDDFLADPQVLIDCAATDAVFAADAEGYYPGIRAPAPPIYAFALRAFLGPAIAEAFGLDEFKTDAQKCDFSMVTTPPGGLKVLQRLPHIDHTSPRHFAALHYLCGPEQGGTSFYRHRATGFEVVDEARFAAYRAAVESELASLGPSRTAYMRGDDAMFERIAAFECRFNRVLVYRGRNLHSADIGPDFQFDSDPRTGRLTANAFFWLG